MPNLNAKCCKISCREFSSHGVEQPVIEILLILQEQRQTLLYEVFLDSFLGQQ